MPDKAGEDDNEDHEAGSIPENTCYVEGREANCSEVAEHPELYKSDDVGLDDEEYREEKAPSDEGPQAIFDNDDQSYRPGEDSEAEERSFEQQYSGINVSFGANAGVSVDVHAASPRLSSWDLRA